MTPEKLSEANLLQCRINDLKHVKTELNVMENIGIDSILIQCQNDQELRITSGLNDLLAEDQTWEVIDLISGFLAKNQESLEEKFERL